MKVSVGLFVIVLFSLLRLCRPYFVTIDAYAEECFFEKVENGTKLGLTFEVTEGGFLDIDIKVTGPEGEVLITRDRESNGKITFAAAKTGAYTYCFSNKMSTMTPKVVMFSMDVREPESTESPDVEDTEHPYKLDDMIKEVSEILVTVKHEQGYMEIRDKIHRRINESTNSRVTLWAAFEAIVLATMTIGQVYYLKRFFEVRCVV